MRSLRINEDSARSKSHVEEAGFASQRVGIPTRVAFRSPHADVTVQTSTLSLKESIMRWTDPPDTAHLCSRLQYKFCFLRIELAFVSSSVTIFLCKPAK